MTKTTAIARLDASQIAKDLGREATSSDAEFDREAYAERCRDAEIDPDCLDSERAERCFREGVKIAFSDVDFD